MSVQFDAAEAALLFSSDTFDIKRRATQKLFVLFEDLRLQLKDTGEHLQFSFPEGVTDISGKISQGENYLGYPWVMLDFPRYFRGEDLFAFRTMFWFGHYFSAHFLLGGRMAEQYVGHVWRNRGLFPVETHFSLHPTAWSHAVGEGASVQFNGLSEEEIRAHVAAHGFIKLSRKWEIADGDQVISEVRAFYAQVLGCLGEESF